MPSASPTRDAQRAAILLGQKVAARRLELQITQEQLAHRAGISRNQVQNIEHSRNNTKDPETGRPGSGNARLDTIFRLAGALDIEVTYLVDPTQPVGSPR